MLTWRAEGLVFWFEKKMLESVPKAGVNFNVLRGPDSIPFMQRGLFHFVIVHWGTVPDIIMKMGRSRYHVLGLVSRMAVLDSRFWPSKSHAYGKAVFKLKVDFASCFWDG
ncbi:hypothetical protein Nepgr_006790 [Nepenthes gracilis]|uniref:Uncharacterized protein n=1 Tax=Nepenthes gracilis TaxID=150966 RepID=A0AAD3XHS2_NEPGR|nr:hypothetical protein Nepgr_006790 [Nepenthes gracilis]